MNIVSLIILLVLLFLISMSFGLLWRVPWVPTRKRDYDRIGKLANLQPNMYFYDLGSGSGDMLFYLSKKYDINCIGIEVTPLLYLYSKIKSLFYKNVKIKYGNFFKCDLSNADVVYVFLLSRLYEKLENKLNKELKKDAKIILAVWPFKDSNPIIVSRKNNEITYYLYKKILLKNQENLLN